jgi:Na+/H+-translocating membrane pyrophosphatase
MGFSLTSLGVLVLLVLLTLYHNWFIGKNLSMVPILYEKISAYGLGGSTMALFGRVGGGIYTKAADVGADLVGKIEE